MLSEEKRPKLGDDRLENSTPNVQVLVQSFGRVWGSTGESVGLLTAETDDSMHDSC